MLTLSTASGMCTCEYLHVCPHIIMHVRVHVQAHVCLWVHVSVC